MSRYPVPDAPPETPHCSELTIRRSRFLAQCAHTPDPESARTFVECVRRRHPDATHNCWAFAAGPPGDTARIGSSDDGEPHGTAGRPMLQVLLHSGVGEICVTVTRWFGGVKLGTGGLVRAYQDSVRQSLEGLPLRQRADMARLRVTLSYAHLDALRRLLPRWEGRIVAEEYHAEASLALALPREHVPGFTMALATCSNGSARCVPEQQTAQAEGPQRGGP